MTLGFMQKFADGSPTHFKEKILRLPGFEPKLHTMREDAHDLWQPGNIIHMVYGNRTPQREQFNEGHPDLQVCISTQKFAITWKKHDYCVRINGNRLTPDEVETLSKNDGFDDLIQFLTYFNESCTRKIIHWTKLRY